ncbi:hypothetical protein ACWENR_10965 [Micromonospora sp. NPDC004336]
MLANVREIVRGRKVVLVGKPLNQYQTLVRQFVGLGSHPPFIVANEPVADTGERTVPDGVGGWFAVPLDSGSFSQVAQQTDELLRRPPVGLSAALDAYDPERAALVFVDSAVSSTHLAGRVVADGREPAWARYEDKTVVDDVWRSIGFPPVPAATTAPTASALRDLHRRLDQGAGTVWSGDASRGVNGTAEMVRWIRDEAMFADAVRFFSANCDVVRVMPFHEGIPAGINAFVTADGVAALRPYEEVTLRFPETGRFYHTGCSTYLDPAPAARAALRDLAVRTGEELRRRVDYRGAFTINGILTGEGFVPTEINPRLGGGHRLMSEVLPELPMQLIQAACILRHPLGVTADELAETVVAEVDRHRAVAIAANVVTEPRTGAAVMGLVRDGAGGLRLGGRGERPDGYVAHVSVGQGGRGGIVTLMDTPSLFRVGEFVAPLVVQALAIADQRWQTGVGPVGAAVPATEGKA